MTLPRDELGVTGYRYVLRGVLWLIYLAVVVGVIAWLART